MRVDPIDIYKKAENARTSKYGNGNWKSTGADHYKKMVAYHYAGASAIKSES